LTEGSNLAYLPNYLELSSLRSPSLSSHFQTNAKFLSTFEQFFVKSGYFLSIFLGISKARRGIASLLYPINYLILVS
jgi:hypothetical protein